MSLVSWSMNANDATVRVTSGNSCIEVTADWPLTFEVFIHRYVDGLYGKSLNDPMLIDGNIGSGWELDFICDADNIKIVQRVYSSPSTERQIIVSARDLGRALYALMCDFSDRDFCQCRRETVASLERLLEISPAEQTVIRIG